MAPCFLGQRLNLQLGAQVSGLLLWAVNVCGSLHSAASFAVLELGVLVLLNSWQPYRPPFQQLWLDPPLCGLSYYFFLSHSLVCTPCLSLEL